MEKEDERKSGVVQTRYCHDNATIGDALLGSRVESVRWDQVVDRVSANDLYRPDRRYIFYAIAEIIIRKQRNRDIGTVNLIFKGEYTRFENFVREELGEGVYT